MQRQTEQAFQWIVDVLHDAGVAFQLAGGLAARAYGATRPLHDVDFYVAPYAFERLLPIVAPYVVLGPEHVTTTHWDIVFMKLEYLGQQIELGDAGSTRIFDREAGQWVPQRIDFDDYVEKEIMGRTVPVMPLRRLVDYKRRLGRPVDLEDVQQMEGSEE